ncbi:MAG: 4Fe-4S dicluster domain-containing protein [Candidatus Verstraetearchaeota archaeon]|nr:4Fe-4S dicluster domain-containing protein [Candidatus Verstraetearchaeota archaeon]
MSTEIKILKQVLSNYSKPMTLNYPSAVSPDRKYSQIPAGLRGIPERDNDKCIGCRACYFVCSGRATSIYDSDAKRKVEIFLFRCTFCAHCQEACPEEAIKMTDKFEIAVAKREDPSARVVTELDLLKCKICGTPYASKKFVDRAYERLMEKIDQKVKETVSSDFKKVDGYCPDCRRANGVGFDTHTKKHVWLEGA